MPIWVKTDPFLSTKEVFMLRPVYELLARDLKAAGVDHAFGLMSDDTALFVTSLDACGVVFHAARHENLAIAMAEGYAAATGRTGVAVIGRGPAMANSLHGATYAWKTGSPVLLVYGATPMAVPATGFKAVDVKAFNSTGVLDAIGIPWLRCEDPQAARDTLQRALHQATNGCTVLLLPGDVQTASLDEDSSHHAVLLTPPARPAARQAAVTSAAKLLNVAKRPLFVVGQGAYQAGARKAIEDLADKTGAVLATSLKAKDMFRGHDFHVGILGSFSHSVGRRCFEHADVIVAFGASMNQRTTSYGTSLPTDVPLIHIDHQAAHIGRWYQADISLVGDAHVVAEQLLQACADKTEADKPFRSAEVRDMVRNFQHTQDFQAVRTHRTMDPRELALLLNELLPSDRNAVYDAGNFYQIVPYIDVQSPGHLKNTADFASIGISIGAAVGFAVGTPDRCTVLFVGDGGLLMTLGELETLAREGLPMVVVVMNDAAYGAELHYLQMRNMPVSQAVFADIDFAPIAEVLGFEAFTVRNLDELRALAPLLSVPTGPVLIDCKINASVMAPFLLESASHVQIKSATNHS